MAEATNKKRASRTSQPITRHPLFPAIVALWFATLVGMGSFVLRTSLIEGLVIAAGIDTLAPAAAPPLGTTARLLIAAVFGLVGGTIGWLLAWRLANPKAKDAPSVLKVADLDETPTKVVPDLDAPVIIAPVLSPASLDAEPAPVEEPEAIEVPQEDTVPQSAAEVVIEQEAVIAPLPPTAAERIASADLAELSHVELIERLAIALRKREALRDEPAQETPIAIPSAIVPFPGRSVRAAAESASRPKPLDTEKALRDALAQLQRMSGNG